MAEAALTTKPGLNRQKTVYVTGNGPTGDISHMYTLDETKQGEIGTPGNFGKAVKCTLNSNNELRCCKIINKARFHHVGELHKIWGDMRNEIRILRELNHPNIVKFHDVFETRGELMIVTELCSGGELFERISKKGQYTELEAANVFHMLLEGLKYMHDQGVIHCDLKPDNFLFKSPADDSICKIIDFGMSKRLPRRQKLNALCGTPYYTAPEILDKSYSHSADMWSMGVVLFVMLFGYPPFYVDPSLYGRKENKMIYQKIKKGFKPVTKVGYGSHFPQAIPVSDDAKSLIAHLLVKDPAKRFTATEALDHPWIRDRADNSHVLPQTVLRGIQKFRKRVCFKNIVCHTFRDRLHMTQVKAVEEALSKLDENDDGVISEEEFMNVMSENSGLDQEALQSLFQYMDADKNGTIDFGELKTAAFMEHVQAQDERLYDQFTQFDLDGDGYISQDELKQVLTQQIKELTDKGEKAHFTVEQALVEMQNSDTDQDGRIDYHEFLAALFPDINEKFEVPELDDDGNQPNLGPGPPGLLRGHTDEIAKQGEVKGQ